MLSTERYLQTDQTPGLEGLSTEEKLYRLYDLYCETGCEDYLGDILLNAEKIGFGIAYNKLKQCSHFRRSDFMDYLQEISEMFLKKLRSDHEKKYRQENIVFTIRSFYRHRAEDLRDALASRYNGRATVSLEALNQTPDGKTIEKISTEEEPSEEELIREKAELCNTITRLYIQTMLGRDDSPQRVMALCYARILYQLEMRYDGSRIEHHAEKLIAKDTRVKYTDFEKMSIAFSAVQTPKKPSSPGWALERMGCQTLLELTADSQSSLQEHFDESLSWQKPFLANLTNPSACDKTRLWKDIVYTEHFTEKQTSAWANSVHMSVYNQLMDLIEQDADLDYDVMRLDTPIKTMMQSLGRGNKYDAYTQR